MTKDPGFDRAHLLDPTDDLLRAPLYLSSPDDALVGASARYVNSPTGDRLRIASFLPAGDCRGTVLVSVGRSEKGC